MHRFAHRSTLVRDGTVRAWLVRFLGLLGLVLAAPFAAAQVPDDLPGYALGVEAILRGERYAVALLGWTMLLVYVGRLAVEGRLPTKISTTGGEWSPAARDAELGELTASVKLLRASLFGPDGATGLVAQHDELWTDRQAALAASETGGTVKS